MNHRLRVIALAVLLLPIAPLPGAPMSTHAAASALPVIEAIEAPEAVQPLAGGTREVEITITVRDDDGWQDIERVVVTVTAPDGALHRAPAEATPQDGSGTERSFHHVVRMHYHDAPAIGSASYRIHAEAHDAGGDVSATARSGFGYLELAAVGVSDAELAFGALLPGGSTEPVPLELANQGNVPIDIALGGTDLTHDEGTIPVTAIAYGLEREQANATTLTNDAATIPDFDLAPGPDATRDTWWTLDVPRSGTRYLPAGAYHGHIRIEAIHTPHAQHQAVPACRNGLDDDGDGAIDFPDDPGCAGLDDADEGLPPLPACTGTAPLALDPIEDPGFPYEDVNDDGSYDSGTDRPVPLYALADGTYAVDPATPWVGLVIPPSTPPPADAPDVWRLQAGTDARLSVLVDLQARRAVEMGGGSVVVGAVEVHAADGHVQVDAAHLVAMQEANVSAARDFHVAAGSVWLAAAHLESSGGALTLTSAEELDVRGATVTAKRDVTLSVQGTLHGRNATMTSGDAAIRMSGASLRLPCATVEAKRDIEMTANDTIAADRGDLTSREAHVTLHGGNGSSLRGAAITARAAITIDTTVGDLIMDQAELGSDTGTVHIAAARDLVMVAADAEGRTFVLEAGNRNDQRATVNEAGGAFQASGARLDMAHATWRGEAEIRIEAKTVDGTSSIVDAQKELMVRADVLRVIDARWSSGDADLTLHASEAANVTSARLHAKRTLEVSTTDGSLAAYEASLHALEGAVRITSAGTAELGAADVSSRSGLEVATHGDLHIQHARFVAREGHLTIDVGDAAFAVFVDGATVADRDDHVTVTPRGAKVEGAPASGVITS